MNKPLCSGWVPTHKDIAKANAKEESNRDDEVHRLAKIAMGLPLLDTLAPGIPLAKEMGH